jgi:hypothetical protein
MDAKTVTAVRRVLLAEEPIENVASSLCLKKSEVNRLVGEAMKELSRRIRLDVDGNVLVTPRKRERRRGRKRPYKLARQLELFAVEMGGEVAA